MTARPDSQETPNSPKAPLPKEEGAGLTLSPQTRTLLSRYALSPRVLSMHAGERLARQAGQSQEFYDVRPYGAGDELRYVDWKAYGRSRKLYTRLFQAERSSVIHLLLDTSPSMQVGAKFAAAQHIGAMLSYIALGMRTQVHLFGGGSSPPTNHRGGLLKLWRYLGSSPIEAPKAPHIALRDYAAAAPHASGMVLILSDLLDPTPLKDALVALRAKRLDAAFIHLMSAADLEPQAGNFELKDAETGESLEVEAADIGHYQSALQHFLAARRDEILHAGFRYAFTRVDDQDVSGQEPHFLDAMYRAGLLHRR